MYKWFYVEQLLSREINIILAPLSACINVVRRRSRIDSIFIEELWRIIFPHEHDVDVAYPNDHRARSYANDLHGRTYT